MNFRLLRRLGILVLALFLTATIASCATKQSSTTSNQPTASPRKTTNNGQAKDAVTIQNNSFSPGSLSVKVGTTVKWTNKDGYDHTIIADGGEFDSGNISSNGTFSFTFDKAATFDYHCSIHPSMTGQIIVK